MKALASLGMATHAESGAMNRAMNRAMILALSRPQYAIAVLGITWSRA